MTLSHRPTLLLLLKPFKRHLYASWMLPVVAFLPFLLAVPLVFQWFNFHLIWDEHLYYADLLLWRENSVWSFLTAYHQPSTPLYYYLTAPMAFATGFDPTPLRWLSFLLSLAGIVVAWNLFQQQQATNQTIVVKTLLLAWSPWYFLVSFLILNDMTALFFFLLGLLWLRRHPVAAQFSILLSVLVRQFFIFFSFVRTCRELFWERRFFPALLSAVPGIGLLLLFFYWGGLTPPANPSVMNFDLQKYTTMMPVYGLTVTAYLVALYHWQDAVLQVRLRYRVFTGSTVAILMISALLWQLYPPEMSPANGLLYAVFAKCNCPILLRQVGGFILFVIMNGFILYALCSRNDLLLACALFFLGHVVIHYHMDKYVLSAVPLILTGLQPPVDRSPPWYQPAVILALLLLLSWFQGLSAVATW